MNCWTILGLEETKDEVLIKEAYHEKLPLFHPEEDPEGFRRLREAYEEALAYHQKEEPAEDLTPTGLMCKEFIALYHDFPRRISPEAWQRLLAQEICQQIDTQEEISEKLLAFLASTYYIPHPVWKLLANFFCWEERQEALKEKFHPNFIDYVLNQSTYEDMIRYDLFPLDKDYAYDEFLDNFYEVNRELNAGETDRLESLLLEADLLGIVHADYELLRLRYYLFIGQGESAEALAEDLLQQYPEDARVMHGAAQCLLRNQKPEAALVLFEKVLAEDPELYSAKLGVAHCHYEFGDYETAKEKYREVLLQYPYDGSAAGAFYAANEKLIPIYQEKLAVNRDDQDIIYKLASCYHNCYRFADGRALLAPVTPTEENAAKHHDLYAYALLGVEEKEEAAQHFLIWETLEKDRSKVAHQLSSALLGLGKEEEAWQKCELYLSDFPQETDLYHTKARILFNRGQWEESLAVIAQGLAVEKDHLGLLIQKAEVFYEMKNYSEALENAAIALRIYPYVYPMLLLQMKIFYEVDNYEEVLQICDRIEKDQLEDPRTNLYRALANLGLQQDIQLSIELLEQYLQENPGETLAVYAVKSHYEDEQDIEKALATLENAAAANPEEIYFRIERARIYRTRNQTKEAFAELTAIEERGPVDTSDFYNEKGVVYERMDNREAAKDCYEKAIAMNAFDGRAYGNLAGIYAQSGDDEKAVEYFTKQLAVREHPYYYISRGLAYGNLKKTEEEKADYLKTIALDPTYAYAYNNLGVVLHDEGCFAEALDYFNQALTHDPFLMSSYRFKAKCLASLGQVDEALEELGQALTFFEEQGREESLMPLYQEKLWLARHHRQYEVGLALAEGIERIGGASAFIYRTLGYCAYELHQDGQAASFYAKALQLNGEDAQIHQVLGHFYLYGKKNLSEARKSCLKAMEIDPHDENVHLLLGKIYGQMKNRKKAQYHFKKAQTIIQKMEKSQWSPCEYFGYAECLQGLEEMDEAEKYYLEAIARSADYVECATRCCYEGHFGLAQIYAGKGEREKAKTHYDEVLRVAPDREYVDAQNLFAENQADKPEKKGLLRFFRR